MALNKHRRPKYSGRELVVAVPIPAKDFRLLQNKLSRVSLFIRGVGATSLAVFDLARDQAAIVSAIAAAAKPGTISELNEAERNLLGYRLDSFLDAARRAQNAIVPAFASRTIGLFCFVSRAPSTFAKASADEAELAALQVIIPALLWSYRLLLGSCIFTGAGHVFLRLADGSGVEPGCGGGRSRKFAGWGSERQGAGDLETGSFKSIFSGKAADHGIIL